MKKYFSTLRNCQLFSQIGDEDLMKMLHCLGAKVESVDKNGVVMEEGAPAKNIGILLSGKAQTIRIDYYGNRSILSEIEPSEMFGEAFACAEVSSVPVTVVANEPCEVMMIDCNHILHTCSNNCDRIMGKMSKNFQKGMYKRNNF